MKFVFILFFPLLAKAEYLIGYGTGAYMGRHQLQGEWISESKKHHALAIIGHTQDQEIGAIHQLGGAYLWALDKKDFENFKWTPLLAGGFFTYTDHEKFYLHSPSKYDNPYYYDITNLRFGFRFGTELMLIRKSEKTIRISLDGSLLEQALIIFINNSSEFDMFPAFWSLGLSIRSEF